MGEGDNQARLPAPGSRLPAPSDRSAAVSHISRHKHGTQKNRHNKCRFFIASLCWAGGGLHHALSAQVILVGAAEVADAIFSQLQDAGRQRGDEFAVVGDEDQGSLVELQRHIQGFD